MPKPKINTVGDKDIRINSLDEYIDLINGLDFISNTNSTVLLFRGQLEAEWDLVPGLGRPGIFRDEIEKYEKDIFCDFKRRAIPFLPKTFNTNSDWEWLALAQHFKLPTRLLDWTENPLIALFFAFEVKKRNTKDRAVWVFETAEDEHVDANDFSKSPFILTKTSVYAPNQITRRITAQSGWFTVHKYVEQSDKFKPFNLNRKFKNRVFKIIIPNKLRNDMLIRLDRLGANSFSIYQDLEGLSHFLRWKYLK